MTFASSREEELADRRLAIVAAARLIAVNEGWSTVTMRRLAGAIACSVPVLYSHFDNREAILDAVACDARRELVASLELTVQPLSDGRQVLRNVATTYLAFADDNPALYEAMFIMPDAGRSTEVLSVSAFRMSFVALTSTMFSSCGSREAAAETLWAALHGLAMLERSGWIAASARCERVDLILDGCLRDRSRR